MINVCRQLCFKVIFSPPKRKREREIPPCVLDFSSVVVCCLSIWTEKVKSSQAAAVDAFKSFASSQTRQTDETDWQKQNKKQRGRVSSVHHRLMLGRDSRRPSDPWTNKLVSWKNRIVILLLFCRTYDYQRVPASMSPSSLGSSLAKRSRSSSYLSGHRRSRDRTHSKGSRGHSTSSTTAKRELHDRGRIFLKTGVCQTLQTFFFLLD